MHFGVMYTAPDFRATRCIRSFTPFVLEPYAINVKSLIIWEQSEVSEWH